MNYVCTERCFIGRLWRPGDVTDQEEIFDHGAGKFTALRSKQNAKMQDEIESLVPQIAEMNAARVKPISNLDLHNMSTPPVVGA